jgi:hypothetical protein
MPQCVYRLYGTDLAGFAVFCAAVAAAAETALSGVGGMVVPTPVPHATTATPVTSPTVIAPAPRHRPCAISSPAI